MLSLLKHRIVSVKQMINTEETLYLQGVSEETLMDRAGLAVADEVEKFCNQKKLEKSATLLVGKGNNGGDAYTAGVLLLQKGFTVVAYKVSSESSPLCKKKSEAFEKAGGKISPFNSNAKLKTVLVDGLLGTGFHGKLNHEMLDAIKQANESHLPILAIDIPSGLHADHGVVSPIAIIATKTIFLGLPKIGFFLERGLDYTGELVFGDLGIGNIDESAFLAYHMQADEVAKLLPHIRRTRHKYEAGYLLVMGGAAGMSGSTALATRAALRSGSGIVRLFYTLQLEPELANYPVELVKELWDGKDIVRILEESKRAKALLLGPGLGRTRSAYQVLKKIIEKVSIPLILDGDALYFLAEHPNIKIPKGSIITPHKQEMLRFFHKEYKGMELFEACITFAKEREITVILKGAATFVFTPEHKPVCITRGDPGMATAGSGDVLAGVVGSLVVQGLSLEHAAILGVFLHAIAGEFAAKAKTSSSMIASDIVEALPEAFFCLICSSVV